jgi:hypothetical protein
VHSCTSPSADFLPTHCLCPSPTSTHNSSSPYLTIASTSTCSLQPPPCLATYSTYNEPSHISNYDFTSRPYASPGRQQSKITAFNCFFSTSSNPLLFSSSNPVTSHQSTLASRISISPIFSLLPSLTTFSAATLIFSPLVQPITLMFTPSRSAVSITNFLPSFALHFLVTHSFPL